MIRESCARSGGRNHRDSDDRSLATAAADSRRSPRKLGSGRSVGGMDAARRVRAQPASSTFPGMQLSGSADAQRAIISAQEKNLPATVTLCGRLA